MRLFKKLIKSCLSKFGFLVFNKRNLPWGIDLFQDIQRFTDLDSIKTVFDVGANVGQSSRIYSEKFKLAKIYAFEPVKSTFVELKTMVNGIRNIECFNIALGEKSQIVKIPIQGKSTLNSLSVVRNEGLYDGENLEEIQVETIDEILLEINQPTIDFLKIDTEGYEMEVLKGSESVLKNNQIKFLLLELGIKSHKRTTYYNQVQLYLGELGYDVLGFYKQSQSLYTKSRFLMHSDVLFVNSEWSKSLKPKFVKSFDFD